MAKHPREHLRWHLLDKSEDPVPWTSTGARSLKRFYERLADAADQAATDMRRLDGDKLGEGKTVEALQELVKELPSHLDKAHTAYEKGYKALEAWADALDTARQKSDSVARLAASAYGALGEDDEESWKKSVGGDDPVRDSHVRHLQRVVDDLDEAAETAKNALEDAKQGSPRKLWGWLDKIVTWVEENPLIYAAIMVVAGIAAIFIPGLGIALALAVLSISAATLHREGKLGFNLETVTTLGLDALSLVPGGVILRGGRAVSRVAGAANRVTGPMRGGISSAATAVRNTRVVQTVSTTVRGNRALRVGADFAVTGTKDTAVGMGSSIAVQMAGGTSWEDIDLKNELIGAAATNYPGAAVGAGKNEWDLSRSGGDGGGTPDIDLPTVSGSGDDIPSSGDPAPAQTAGDPAPAQTSGDPAPAQTNGGEPAPSQTGGDAPTTQSADTTASQSGGDPGPGHADGGDTPPPDMADASGSHTPSPDAPEPGNRIDIDGNRGEYRTVEGPNGERNITYRYPTGNDDYTMNVSPRDVTVNGTSVQRTDDGFQVAGSDGASVTISNGGLGKPGTVDLTRPGGDPGPSYGPGGSDRPGHADHPGEVRVPTRDGDVSVYRGDDGSTIRTDDGLTVSQSRDGDAQITHRGDAPVDLRFNDGPHVSRPEGETGATPPVRVADPSTGRTTEIGTDGYRVDTEGGTSQGYDRGTDTATVDSGSTRIDAGQHSVRVTDESRGVHLWQGRGGSGAADGAGSSARVQRDGSAEIRTNNPSLTPRATQDAHGNVTIGNTRTEPGRVTTEDGTTVQIGRDRDGADIIEVRAPDGTTWTHPVADGSSMLTNGTRVTVIPGADPSLRVDTSQGWTVNTSRGGEVSVSTPSDGRGDRLHITRRPDGSTEMSSGDHRIESRPERSSADGPRVFADGPGGVRAGSSDEGAYVSDSSTRTDVQPGSSPGLGTAETTRTAPPFGPVAQHTGAEGRVPTDSGVTVRTTGNEVSADVPRGSDHTVRNGGRTIDANPNGTSMRGPSPDTSETVPLRMGETAGDAGRVPPGWRVEATSDGRMSGSTHPDNRISVRSPDDTSRQPHMTSSPDVVEFRTGDVSGDQTRSGRNEVTDGNGTTVRDGRRGVRVDSGDDSPELRITEDQVRVNAPNGEQQRVDIPRSDDASGGDRRGDDASTDGTPPPVRQEQNSLRTTIAETMETLIKNAFNVTGGLIAEHLWIGGDGAGIQAADLVQAVAQMGTAVPKGLAEGRIGDTSDLPPGVAPFTLEMSHQAARNMWRDDIMDQYYGDEADTAGELSDVGARIDFLGDELIPEIEKEIKAARRDGDRPEELARLEALHSAATDQKKSLEQEKSELHDELTHLD